MKTLTPHPGPHRRRCRGRAALIAVVAAVTTTAAADARTPIRDCGDIANGGASAVTAQGVTCTAARAVARIVPGKKACAPTAGGCQVRGYTCLTGQAGKELFLVRCENSAQTRFIRFEYGS
jgi:hypothetical protein